jgi:hypothetical protein
MIAAAEVSESFDRLRQRGRFAPEPVIVGSHLKDYVAGEKLETYDWKY